MAIALVQSNEGTSTLATTTATLSTAPTSGNLIVLAFASDDYNGTPDSGWTQSTGLERQGFHGGYIWWRISNGTNSFPYTIGSASNSSWVVAEFSGVDPTPYDISNGQNVNTSGTTYTTPSITPTAGDRLLVAAQGGSSNTHDLSGDTTTWLNTFTHIRTSGPVTGTGTWDIVGMAYRLVTANGSTGYSSGATYPAGVTAQSRSGMIIAFKAATGGATNVSVDVTTNLATASGGSVTAGAVTNISTTLGGQSVTTSVGDVTASGATGGGGGTAPVFRAVSSTTYANVADTDIAKPTGTVDGDIMVASLIMFRSGGQSTAPVVPSGWTQIGSYVADGPLTAGLYRRYGIWWKRASSEPSSYQWSQWESASTQGTIQSWSGCIASGDPVDASSSNSGTGTTATGTGITTTVANAKLLFIAQNFDLSTTLTPPTGMTERFDSLTYLADETRASSGATSNRTQTQASGDPWSVFMVALKPVPGGGGTNVSADATTNLATTSVGSVTVTAIQNVSTTLTGQSVTVSVNSATVTAIQHASTSVTGQSVTVSVGDINVPQVGLAFLRATSTTYASRSDTTIIVPSGIQDDDILIASVIMAQTGSFPLTPTVPSGWTRIGSYPSVPVSNPRLMTGVWWRRAFNEPTSYTWSHGETLLTQGTMQAWSGVISGNPIDASGAFSSMANPATNPGVTTTVANTALIHIVHNMDGTGTLSPPTGFTERLDSYTYLADKAWPTIGATGTITQTLASSTGYTITLVALKPQPVAVSTNASGNAVTASVGSVTVQLGGQIFSVTGNQVTTSVGGVTVGGTGNVPVTGQAVTTYLGDASATGGGAGTPPVFRSFSNTSYVGRSDTVIAVPGSTTVGDILIASLAMFRVSGTTAPVIPAGWTQIGTYQVLLHPASTLTSRVGIFWKRATASEPADYTWAQWESASTQGTMQAWTGAITTGDPIDAFSAATDIGGTATATGITTTVANTALLYIGQNFDASGTLSPPTGMTEHYDSLTYLSDEPRLSAGATGNRVQTLASSGGLWTAFLLALKPATDAIQVSVNVTGQSVTVSVGSVTISTPGDVFATGNQAAVSVNGVTILTGSHASTLLTGQVLTVSVGNVSLPSEVVPPVMEMWTNVAYGTRNDTTVGKPIGTVDGSILLTGIFYFFGSAADPGNITPPAGFTAVAPSTIVTGTVTQKGRFQVFWKRVTNAALEPASYAYTHPSYSTQAVMARISGAMATGNPINAWSQAVGVGSTTMANSITTTRVQTLLTLWGHNWDIAGSSPPTGWTENFDSLLTVATTTKGSIGPTGPVSHTPNGSVAGDPWQAWLMAITPFGSGDVTVELTGFGLTASVGNPALHFGVVNTVTGHEVNALGGTANVRINGGMTTFVTGFRLTASMKAGRVDVGQVELIQSAKGTSTLATTTIALPNNPVLGSVIVLSFASNDYNENPDAGWVQSAGMEQQVFHGGYLWWRVSDGSNSFTYTIKSATNSAWVLAEFSNVDPTPYDGSAGISANVTNYGYTTPLITPTQGQRLLVAGINGSATDNLASASVTGWTNGFTAIDSIGTGIVGTNDLTGMAYGFANPLGGFSYQTGAAFSPSLSLQSQSGLIISLMKKVTRAFAATHVMTASVGSVQVITDQILFMTGQEAQTYAGGFSVSAGGATAIRVENQPLHAFSGHTITPLYYGWNIVTIGGSTVLSNDDMTMTAAVAAEGTAASTTAHFGGKHYVEVTVTGEPTGTIGLYNEEMDTGTRIVLETGDVLLSPSGALIPTFAPLQTGDVIGIAYSGNKGEVWFRINDGQWNNDEDQTPGVFDWPDATNTGYKNAPGYPGHLTPWTGAADFRDIPAGTRFEFIEFNGMAVYEPNVTFYGCRFFSSWTGGWQIKTIIDEELYPDAVTTFQFCTIEPPDGIIPNPAWPSAGAGVPVDGVSPGYQPYMHEFETSFQYGIIGSGGGLLIEDCDIWGFGNSITLYGYPQKTIQRCWIHDAADPHEIDWASGGGYHTDGPGHLDNQGCHNVLIRDCTIASLGNTNAIAFQRADTLGYKNIVIRHNYLSGFGFCVNMGWNAAVYEDIHFFNNVIATDIRWAFGPLYNDLTPQFAGPGKTWSGNSLSVRPGTSKGPLSTFNFTAADDGKFMWPDGTIHDTDFEP